MAIPWGYRLTILIQCYMCIGTEQLNKYMADGEPDFSLLEWEFTDKQKEARIICEVMD